MLRCGSWRGSWRGVTTDNKATAVTAIWALLFLCLSPPYPRRRTTRPSCAPAIPHVHPGGAPCRLAHPTLRCSLDYSAPAHPSDTPRHLAQPTRRCNTGYPAPTHPDRAPRCLAHATLPCSLGWSEIRRPGSTYRRREQPASRGFPRTRHIAARAAARCRRLAAKTSVPAFIPSLPAAPHRVSWSKSRRGSR